MAEKKKCRLSDESLNGDGFWVKTDGIDISLFMKNPIMLYNHNRWDDKQLPPGKWENVQILNGELIGEPVFDTGDELGANMQRKFEGGFINMVSIGAQVIEMSEDPSQLKPGQKYPTVTKCLLKEVSFVDVGSNRNCIRLYDSEGKQINLQDNKDHPEFRLIDKPQEQNQIQKTDMKQIALKLGLAENAAESDILNKIDEVLNANKTLRDEKDAGIKLRAKELVEGAIAAKKILGGQKDNMIALAEKDYDSVRQMIENMVAPKDLSKVDEITLNDRKIEKFEDLAKLPEDEFMKFRDENRSEYIKLYEKHFGRKPDFKA